MSQAEVMVAGELETQQQVCQTLESELQELELEIMQCQQSKREVRVCVCVCVCACVWGIGLYSKREVCVCVCVRVCGALVSTARERCVVWSLWSLGPMLLSSYYIGFLPYHVVVALVPGLPLFRARHILHMRQTLKASSFSACA